MLHVGRLGDLIMDSILLNSAQYFEKQLKLMPLFLLQSPSSSEMLLYA
jgi:hypothetical protein